MSLASRGLRDMDGGPEKIDDAAELAIVRRQARKIYVESVIIAAALAGLALLAPR